MNLESLFKKASEGDKTAEEELFRVLSERFRQFADHRIWNKGDSEDVVQNAMMTIVNEYKNADIRSSFSAWAYKVFENRFLSYIGGKSRARKKENLISQNSPKENSGFSDPALKLRLLNCLKKINRLNARHARILNFRYQGYTAEEISRKLGVSRNGVYILLSRARKMLETCLKTGEIK